MNRVLSIAHSTVFHWPIFAMFSSNKISQHSLHSNIPYRLSIAHALHSFCMQARQTTSAMLSALHIAAMHPKHKHICVSGDKMAQDVGCSAVYTCSNLDLWFYYFSLLELRPIDSVLDPGLPSQSALHVMLRKWTDRCTRRPQENGASTSRSTQNSLK